MIILSIKNMLKEAKWLMALLALSMAFKFGGSSKLGDTILERVNGLPLTLKRFRAKVEKDKITKQAIRAYGFKMEDMTEEEALTACEHELVMERLIQDLGLSISDEDLIKGIKKIMPKSVFEADGSINKLMYQNITSQMGFRSVVDFEEERRLELQRELLSKVLEASFGDVKADAKSGTSDGAFEVQYHSINKKQDIKEGAITSDMIKSHYEKYSHKFKDRGSASLIMFKINKNLLEKESAASIVADEILAFYKRNKERKYSTPARYSWKAISINVDGQEGLDKVKSILTTCAADSSLFSEKIHSLGFVIDEKEEHNVSFEEGRYASSKIQGIVRKLKAVGDFSDAELIDGKVCLIKLLGKEPRKTKALSEVENEIKKNIATKKAEYKFDSLVKNITKQLREIGAKNLKKEDCDRIAKELAGKDIISFDRYSAFDNNKRIPFLSDEIEKKLDIWEAGFIGKGSEADEGYVYIVKEVRKKQVQPLESVKESVRHHLERELAKKKAFDDASSIKSSLMQSGSWPSSIKIQSAHINKGESKTFGPDVLAKVKKLVSTRQVLLAEDSDNYFVIRLTADRSSGDIKLLTESDYLEHVLAGIKENAKIEKYLGVKE